MVHMSQNFKKIMMHENAQYLEIYGCLCSHYPLYYTHLDPTNYVLNFGIIALHEVRPRVIIRFTLKNTRNNRKQTWTQLIAGETLMNSLKIFLRL